MAKTQAERQAKYRKSISGDESKHVVNVGISVTVVTELERLCKQYGETKRSMVERLIMQGIVEKFNGAAKARELFQQYGRDTKAAMDSYRGELKLAVDGFKANSKLPEHAEASKRYDSVRRTLHRLTREAKTGT